MFNFLMLWNNYQKKYYKCKNATITLKYTDSLQDLFEKVNWRGFAEMAVIYDLRLYFFSLHVRGNPIDGYHKLLNYRWESSLLVVISLIPLFLVCYREIYF